jgi:hypothetical protein
MASKTFKLGEYAKGGVITAEVKGTKVTIIGKDWDTSVGYKRSRSQSNAKEFGRLTVDSKESQVYHKLSMYLRDLTVAYYANIIIDWVETKTKLGR